ncbi:MAG: hypothetical protein ACREXR_19140 [Gammaproteobacteria bacterium]
MTTFPSWTQVWVSIHEQGLVALPRRDAPRLRGKLDWYIVGCQIGITLSSLILGALRSGPD